MKKLLAAATILGSTLVYAENVDMPVECFETQRVIETLAQKQHTGVFKGETVAQDGTTITTNVTVGPDGDFALILTNNSIGVSCVVIHGQTAEE